jgi:hypothetical protein
LVIGFIEDLKKVTTSDYSAIADSRILQFTTACTKSFQSDLFTSRFLVTVSNCGRSPYLRASQLSPCLSSKLLTATAHKD